MVKAGENGTLMITHANIGTYDASTGELVLLLW